MEELNGFQISKDLRLFQLGLFDQRVTVLSQQIRALNLAGALAEEHSSSNHLKLAIVGAGFSGLTLAAGLLQKQVKNIEITIFEEKDSLIPLQQGSDSRWLHPRIYNWPSKGSRTMAAMLPVLNWTAGRASDVVFQVLSEWKAIVNKFGSITKTSLYCNTRHIQIDRSGNDFKIEWIGELRNSSDGTLLQTSLPEGQSNSFDAVVLATGFGVEAGGANSYWRNETIGQPNLDEPKTTYLVSGQGDGALIDLLRTTISQFRQDRILTELFSKKHELLLELTTIQESLKECGDMQSAFSSFEELTKNEETAGIQINQVIKQLRNRIRRDTESVLNTKEPGVEILLRNRIKNISFQNALLLFLVYKCGGFAPTKGEQADVARSLKVDKDNIITRHGTNRLSIAEQILSEELYSELENAKTKHITNHQQAEVNWPGGYFGLPISLELVEDENKATWRKEYLPGTTSVMATALCGSLSGAISIMRPEAKHYRVTIHRVLAVHKEQELLQQACDYCGQSIEFNAGTAGRTFPLNATIGLAYKTRSVVASKANASPTELQEAMKILDLDSASRQMKPKVTSLISIPILQPADEFLGKSPVVGIVYIDSQSEGFSLENDDIRTLCNIIQESIDAIIRNQETGFDRVQNFNTLHVNNTAPKQEDVPAQVSKSIQLLSDISAPSTKVPFQLNFEYTDLSPISLTV